jgi:hypothetical protein
MKPIASAIVCITVLYWVDITFYGGIYFRATTAVIFHILNGH